MKDTKLVIGLNKRRLKNEQISRGRNMGHEVTGIRDLANLHCCILLLGFSFDLGFGFNRALLNFSC